MGHNDVALIETASERDALRDQPAFLDLLNRLRES